MKEMSQEDISHFLELNSTGIIYLYTPLCGTCQTASKMMKVLENLLPNIPILQANLNYVPEIAKNLSIESVPCLMVVINGQINEKIYAFNSVPYLYEKLQNMLK
ncbi:thioredoxin family protein [Neobacillus sp. D3-1R]|uniref:thioredoxin family protein n=1 Tax=Neobacillus sp. D3-1R TaxID=3445778 RepID=UPI003FA04B5E